MRINHKVLSIPPYLSTSWKNILSLRADRRGPLFTLIVNLQDGSIVEIPELEPTIMDAIFAIHAKHLESESNSMQRPQTPAMSNSPFSGAGVSFAIPLKMELPGIENLGAILHHNMEHCNAPNLPEELLQKIASLTKSMGVQDLDASYKPEPHCNCPHCQIARSMLKAIDDTSDSDVVLPCESLQEEEISDEDLRFHSWSILQTSDTLYTVTNPDDAKEQYQVFLGTPIGCTCGANKCEHIRAVLNS